MFGGMLFFIAIQLVFFFRGVSTTPWYNSGMYSELITPQPVYEVYNLPCRWGSGVQLLSPQRDDKIFVTLERFHHPQQNDTMYEKASLLFEKAHLPSLNKNRFFHSLDRAGFMEWFTKYSSPWISPYSGKSDFAPKAAFWDGHTLSLTQSPTPAK